MEEILNNARLLELSQLYMSAVCRIASDLDLQRIPESLRHISKLDRADIEIVLKKSLKEFMNNCKSSLFEIIEKYSLFPLFQTSDTHILHQKILKDLESDPSSLEMAKMLLFEKWIQPKPQQSKASLEQELQIIKSENSYLEEEKTRIFEEIMQLRLNLITKVNL